MGLIERLQGLFSQPEKQKTPVTAVQLPDRKSWATVFGAEKSRADRVRMARKMYEEDARIEGVLQHLSRDITKGGFNLSVDGPRAQQAEQVISEALKSIEFEKRISNWVELTLRDGDSFIEVATNARGQIVHASRKPTLEMNVWADRFGNFKDPARAFWFYDRPWYGAEPPTDALWFAQWQIVHARYTSDENDAYGRPLFNSAVKHFKRFDQGELDIAIRRKTRAGLKFLHSLEDATEADIEEYIQRNKDALDDPFAAVADFFSSKKTAVQAIQGDANLGNVEDIMHHIRTFWISSPVPMALVGYSHDINRDVLQEQKEQYDSAKEELGRWVSEQFIYPIAERALLFAGIWPDALEITAEWATKEEFSASNLKEAGDAISGLVSTGLFQDETLIRLFGRFVPDFDVDAEIKAAEERADQEAERIERTMAQFEQGDQNDQEDQEDQEDDDQGSGSESGSRAK